MFNKIMILVLIVLLLAPAAGCNKSSTDSNIQDIENPKQAENLEYEEITDPAELEQLWQEYLYDSITTVGNTREFNSAQEIDPLNVAKYCWFKYVEAYGKESLELAGEGSTSRLFPLDTVLEYAQRYFDLTSLDVSNIKAHSYDQQKQAFLFNLGSDDRNTPSYNAGNPWGIYLDKVTRNNDGTITAVLINYGPGQTERIDYTETYTLKQREDGSLYFVNGRRVYINNHLVTITGHYQRFDKIIGFEGNMQELSMLGELNGLLILAYTPYDQEKTASLMLVDPETMKVEKQLEVSANFAAADISLVGDSIVIRLNDRIISVDKTLAQSDEVSLPAAITEKINREPRYDKKGNNDIYFGGYDVSSDKKRYVYTDETGVKLLNTADNSEKLLAPTPAITSRSFQYISYYNSPRFVAHEQKVITTMIGYESAMNYTLCDLESGAVKTYEITSESSSTCFIRYDTGLLEVNTPIYNREKQSSEYNTYYLDFRTGEFEQIVLTEPGDTGDIRMPYHCYVGQGYSAFITYNTDYDDNANNMFYLNQLNLNTLLIETQIISIKAAETHILGVLADGRIVFWYNYNPSENGICIT